MPQKSLGQLTEPMFYVLMAFSRAPRCGTEVSAYVEQRTHGRVRLGPGTLYTILAKFEEVGYLREIEVVGRRRTYEITQTGWDAYQHELDRLRQCLTDAEQEAIAWQTTEDKPADRSAAFPLTPQPVRPG